MSIVADDAKLTIVTHHKSGTFAGWGLFINLCCPPRTNLKGFVWDIVAGCKRFCPSATYEVNGIPNHTLQPNNYYLHIIRHPVDMIVSGYLYHRACFESQWTDGYRNPTLVSLHVPKNFHVKGSYCKFLKENNSSVGLEAEAYRSLHAFDGVGSMLRDFAIINNSSTYAIHNSTILQVCMNEMTGKMAHEVERFTKPWSKFGKPYEILNREEHKANFKEVRQLYHEAVTVAMKFIPLHVLITFPCSAQSFDDQSEDWITLLRNLRN